MSDEDPMPKGRAKKNRKRWCGGHEGREHIPVVTKSNYAGGFQCGYRKYAWGAYRYKVSGVEYSCWHEISCQKCHKTLKYRSDSCPDRIAAWDKYVKETEKK